MTDFPGRREHLLIVSGANSKIRTSYNPPLVFNSLFGDERECNEGYEMALVRLETYFSFPNIDVSNNCIHISNDQGKTWCKIAIPTGCYDIESINTIIQGELVEKYGKTVKDKLVNFSPNKNTLKCRMQICTDLIIVDFNIDNSLRTVLGFSAKQYKGKGRYESEHLVNILSVNSILVHCDIVGASRLNGVEVPVIYNFFPNVSPGEKIVSQPLHIIYMPITMNVISSVTAWLTDQNQKELNLRGEELTLTFHIRKSQ